MRCRYGQEAPRPLTQSCRPSRDCCWRCRGPAAETSGNKNPARERRKVVAQGPMSNSPHILVVEDDREISRLVSRYLRDHDCRVSLAGDGREMDRVMASSRIDLVILDLMLPGEDGLSLCRRLRAGIQPADHHADRHGRRGRPHRRPGDGRRRLSRQAVQSARAPRPRPRRAAADRARRHDAGRPRRPQRSAFAAGGSTAPCAS